MEHSCPLSTIQFQLLCHVYDAEGAFLTQCLTDPLEGQSKLNKAHRFVNVLIARLAGTAAVEKPSDEKHLQEAVDWCRQQAWAAASITRGDFKLEGSKTLQVRVMQVIYL